MFGGNGQRRTGGGGAGLGGAIFNDSGVVFVLNSTFTGNVVTRGPAGSTAGYVTASPGRDAGGAIFSRNGRLTLVYTTISGNAATGTGFGGGVVVVRDGAETHFTLQNTIIANNGSFECAMEGTGITADFLGNVIESTDDCGVPVSIDDPQLGPLRDNQGPTPTMAIPLTSPAWNAADSSVTLPLDRHRRDQRGQERPSMGGYDIGSFELCLGPFDEPCILTGGFGTPDTRLLTIGVSPAGTGTTSPTPGTHEEPFNSVVPLLATPNTSYRFVNWTGDPVGYPTSASTFIGMDGAKTVTANFQLFDFNFSSIAPLSIPVGGSGSRTITVNSMGAFNAPVTLGVSGQPSGSIPTLNPASITPAAGLSASSQLNVSLGPSVLSGPYTINVRGTAGPLVHSTPVSLTVVSTPGGVIQVIGTLQALGCIDNAGVANAFTTKLAQAQAAIAAGNTQKAINTLTALLHQLQAQTDKHITTSCRDSNGVTFNPVAVLIADVQALLNSLSTAVQANPIMGSVVSSIRSEAPDGEFSLVDSTSSEAPGAVVSLLDSSKKVVAMAPTDETGFYFFADTRGLRSGKSYSVRIAILPSPYRKSAPGWQVFLWSGREVTLGDIVLY